MVTRSRQAGGRKDEAGWGRGRWGSENTHKIRSAFSGMAPGKPLCMALINSLFCFFELCCVKGRGTGGVRRCCLLLAICVVTVGMLERAYCDRQNEYAPGDV
jgi:hypothetical protein